MFLFQIHPTQHLLQKGVIMTLSIRTKRLAAIGAVGVAAMLAVAITVPSGADFNATKPANITITTTSLQLGVSDEDNSGTIDLDFTNLKPGDAVSHTFNVTNISSFTTTGKFGPGVEALSVTGGDQANIHQGDLRVGLWESNGPQVGLVAVNLQPAGGWDLGTFAPGQTKTFTVMVKLGHGAGNEWQNVVIDGNVPVTLTQQ